ncbi:hypothetical protein [Saccharibacillus kuerlensis]|uniref:Uncharacterized protein n=1 Tax=Saccharibacillus kuerlensis TaxID=459527 RepID=A0ABQ2KQH1_9BACL|nr:hypothetical protein [Saccharibacillus kuerlensis]GGN90339.1 hypothetical protein GCM10010969_00710 [Saccharibacillus kuerlensis]
MKAIEVQLAVHRAPETSRMQQEHLQRPLIDQVQLTEQANIEVERARHRSAPSAEASDAHMRKDGKEQEKHHSHQGKESKTPDQESNSHFAAAPHPYKGKHLDLSL